MILLVGIVLMLLPTGSKESTQQIQAEPTDSGEETATTLQQQLSDLLSQVDGAGKVQVLLTEAAGEQVLYQEDENTSSGDQSQTSQRDTVILGDSERGQQGLVRQVNPPTYLGAVVLCQGADQASVRLALTQAVANATGLGYDKITVLKMK